MSNATELINYAKDLDFEYNIKLLLLIIITVYAIVNVWYWKNTEVEYLYQHYLKQITLILSKVWFIALPLWVLFLSRTVALDVILQPLIVFYGVAGLLFMVLIYLFGAEYIKKFFTGETFYRNRK
jgi:hypothetical protein